METAARIGKYELEEYLGGGMSRVYRARDTVIGRTVAVKILTEEGCANPEAKARFLQEARVAGNIEHENIIRIFDFGEDAQGRPYMVMEFLRGEDLRGLIKRGGAGDLRSKLKLALQAARALEHIHSRNIIHRDVKPDNLLLTDGGVVKLMDFGIAKSNDAHLTRDGFTLGTPYYMPPEQVRGDAPTPLMDIYAFGILVFELLTGVRPVEGDTIETIFYKILSQPVDCAPLDAVDAPEEVKALVRSSVSKEPSERPQGFGAVCAVLERAIGGAAPAPKPVQQEAAQPAAETKARKPWLAPAIVAGVAALILIGYFAIRPAGEAPPAAEKPEPAAVISTPAGEMVLVPAGPFLYGSDQKQADLPAFYIDRTEVTNAAYAAFCAAKSHPLPAGFRKDLPDYPVTNVSYLDALEFAQWAGKRLPSALEWEKAARGQDGRSYPWGAEEDARRANVRNNPDRPAPGLMPANSLAAGAGAVKILHVVGNAWEFVADRREPSAAAVKNFAALLNPPPAPNEPWYAIRGGGYDTPLSPELLWDSATLPARYANVNIGFRCVK